MMDLLHQQVKDRVRVQQIEWCKCTDQTPEAQQSRIDVIMAEALDDFGDDEDDEDDEDED